MMAIGQWQLCTSRGPALTKRVCMAMSGIEISKY